MAHPAIHLVHVFCAGPNGGNPAPIVLDARGMSDDAMRDVAREHRHESGFVLPPPDGSDADLAMRFWVPNHEMEMCGHVTVGAVWLLERHGRLSKDRLRIHTPSGMVEALINRAGDAEVAVEISQPVGHVETLACPDLRSEIASLLDIEPAALGDGPIQNARTSRVKTLVPISSIGALDALRPDFSRVATLCERLGSTGLYPYAVGADPGIVDARQFPKASGYPEDAATGIAAAALAFGLREQDLLPPTLAALRVRQGRAMGHPSEISIRFEHTHSDVTGCWIGGVVRA
ncbi:PhzF family phenazine biosynthesis protein [Luteimonas deserti]|uniref:PhzF family phenazine biosynthesis protein n=1 Tax=Luteimonas deserti TaxID=2752306 RepID=A0A7Z0QNU2_9GAMM|nr:PhzF family phenazine biosynthesis isomerase [Luteimonas deserti]NYZ61559.1 PhzF family phenazine biosynthesis protein [Luteimonas deserti]